MLREDFIEDFKEGDLLSLQMGDMRLEGRLVKVRESSIRLQVEGERSPRTLELARIWECHALDEPVDEASAAPAATESHPPNLQIRDNVFGDIDRDYLWKLAEEHAQHPELFDEMRICESLGADSLRFYISYFIGEDDEKARRLYEAALELYPNSLSLWMGYTFFLQHKGNNEEVIESCRNSIRSRGNSVDFFLFAMGSRALIDLGRHEEASEFLRTFWNNLPQTDEILDEKKSKELVENMIDPSSETEEENKEDEWRRFRVPNLLKHDIEELAFTDEQIVRNGGIPTKVDASRLSIAASEYEESYEDGGGNREELIRRYLEAVKAFSMVKCEKELKKELKAVAKHCVSRYAQRKREAYIEEMRELFLHGASESSGRIADLCDAVLSYSYVELVASYGAGGDAPEEILKVLAAWLEAVFLRCFRERREDALKLFGAVGESKDFQTLVRAFAYSGHDGLSRELWKAMLYWGSVDEIRRLLPRGAQGPEFVFDLIKEDEALKDSFLRFMEDASGQSAGQPGGERRLFRLAVERQNERRDHIFELGRSAKSYLDDSHPNFQWLANFCSGALEDAPYFIFFSTKEVLKTFKDVADSLTGFDPDAKDADIRLRQASLRLSNPEYETNGLPKGVEERLEEVPTTWGRGLAESIVKASLKGIQSLQEAVRERIRPALTLTLDPVLFHEEADGAVVTSLLINNTGRADAVGMNGLYRIMVPGEDGALEAQNTTLITGPATIAPDSGWRTELRIPPALARTATGSADIVVEVEVEAERCVAAERFTVEVDSGAGFSAAELPWDYQRVPKEIFGRDDLLGRLCAALEPQERSGVRMLYGVTRSGKTSILRALRKRINGIRLPGEGPERRVFCVNWDFSRCCDSRDAEEFWQDLLDTSLEYSLADWEDDMSEEAWDDAAAVEALSAGLSEKKAQGWHLFLRRMEKAGFFPVFLVDEFAMYRKVFDSGVAGQGFLMNIRQAALEDRAAFFMAGTYDLKELMTDERYGITGQFVNMVPIFVTRIEEEPALSLVRLFPRLRFSKAAEGVILDHADLRPYLIQMICRHCGLYAAQEGRSVLGLPEVESVIAALAGEKKLAGVDALPANRFDNNLIFSAEDKEGTLSAVLSMLARSDEGFTSYDDLRKAWDANGLACEALGTALDMLTEREVLEKREEPSRYRIRVPLFRRWWKASHGNAQIYLDRVKR